MLSDAENNREVSNVHAQLPCLKDTPRPAASLGECLQKDTACSAISGESIYLLANSLLNLKPLH